MSKIVRNVKMSGPVVPGPALVLRSVPQYGPEWVAHVIGGGEVRDGNVLVAPRPDGAVEEDRCPTCDGAGHRMNVACDHCGGAGWFTYATLTLEQV